MKCTKKKRPPKPRYYHIITEHEDSRHRNDIWLRGQHIALSAVVVPWSRYFISSARLRTNGPFAQRTRRRTFIVLSLAGADREIVGEGKKTARNPRQGGGRRRLPASVSDSHHRRRRHDRRTRPAINHICVRRSFAPLFLLPKQSLRDTYYIILLLLYIVYMDQFLLLPRTLHGDRPRYGTRNNTQYNIISCNGDALL